MQPIDYIVLFIYFAVMAGIGFWLMRKQKRQEDFFMGGRSFGKLMQTFGKCHTLSGNTCAMRWVSKRRCHGCPHLLWHAKNNSEKPRGYTRGVFDLIAVDHRHSAPDTI